MPERTCIFCGPTDAKITDEHVWPQWLSKLFRDHGVRHFRTGHVRSTHAPPTGTTSTSRQHAATHFDTCVKVVCEPCNSTWLSDLENNVARPLLTPLVMGRTARLSLDAQLGIAAWIVKLAMVYEFTAPKDAHRFFSQADRERFKDDLLPTSGVRIWLAAYNGTRHINSAQTILLSAHSQPRYELFTTTGSIGRLAFQLAGHRWPDATPSETELQQMMEPVVGPWESASIALWPNLEEPVRWPPPQYVDDVALSALCDRWGRGPLADAPSALSIPMRD